VTHVVLRHLGLASEEYSIPYVAGWLAADRRSSERGLGHTQALAVRIIAALDGNDSKGVPPRAAPPTSLAESGGDRSTDNASDSGPAAVAADAVEVSGTYRVSVTHEGRTLDRRKAHGTAGFTRSSGEGARTGVGGLSDVVDA
jgi:hypothetical protein